MSKLIDKLNRVARPAPEPMGFRITPAAPANAKLLLIARFTRIDNIAELADQTSGADAVLLHLEANASARILPQLDKALSGMPWGVWLGETGKIEVASLVKAGADFIVFPTTAPLATPEGNGTGKILQIETGMSEGLIRAVNDLPVDAVMVAEEKSERDYLTWRHLLFLQRAAEVVEVPLLIAVPAEVTARELQLLVDAGVDGVVATAGQIASLRQMIDKLSPPTPRKRHMVPVIPHLHEEAVAVPEEEEEDE